MRLANIQSCFLPDGDGLKCCRPGKAKALARIVPDKVHAGMWRVVRPDGRLSDLLNRARAKDVACGMAESQLFVGEGRDVA
jgi:hypothetical protein